MVILESDQRKMPEDQILGKEWAGQFQLFCSIYTDHPVTMQIRDPDDPDSDWIDAKFNGKTIQLTAAGEVLDIKLARNFDYQLVTETAGAKVHIAKHNVHA